MPDLGEAEWLRDSDLLRECFERIERDHTERAINAPLPDDETRRVEAMMVRAVREVRGDLDRLLADAARPTPPAVV